MDSLKDIALQKYIPYEGQLFEGPTPDQLRGFEEVRDTLGGYKPRLEAAETLAQIEAGTTDTSTSNKQIETDADDVLDFSEGNPFSEGTNY